ncbi:MAG: DUF4288 domain-containing protein [Bacteroidia bacterium]
MYWYLSKLIFRIVYHTGGKSRFDEQLRLIKAENENSAFARAMEIGSGEEENFTDPSGRKVEWKFIAIAELSCLKELKDGQELVSRTEEPDNEEEYLALQRLRAVDILRRLPVESLYTGASTNYS